MDLTAGQQETVKRILARNPEHDWTPSDVKQALEAAIRAETARVQGAKTDAKRAASIANGKLGGRPKGAKDSKPRQRRNSQKEQD